MQEMKGKVAIVTGAAKGIGKGIACCLAKRGCSVVVVDVLADEAKATAKELQEQGLKAEAYVADMLQEQEISSMMEYVHERYGGIHILVDNAGITVRKPAMSVTPSEFDQVIGVDLRGYYLAACEAARYMREQEERGCIVCISSCNSQHFTSKRSLYNIAKAAVNGMVATLGVEWGRLGIRVNGVAPGYVRTDMVDEGIRQGIIDLDKIMPVIPMKRFLTVEEIGNAVCFLVSDEASGITGQTLFVDGGWSQCGLPEEMEMEV